ncbi:MAG: disulfide bond formation protein B [Chlamydiae bacterium]|nr:disulfide bond formation protein B [Chlamydiota bacterium]
MHKQWVLFFAWITAAGATIGSLFFSEVISLEPSDLGWYQRICMYPLAWILGVAFYKKFYGIVTYVFPFTLIGTALAGMLAIRAKPGEYSIGLGPINVPFLSLAAFGTLTLLLLWLWNKRTR